MPALIDELIGLPNHDAWALMLCREEARCARYGSTAAVLALALDDDTGEDDLVLRTAITLSSVLRPSDVIARMDATAFAVLLVECDRATAVPIAHRRQINSSTCARHPWRIRFMHDNRVPTCASAH